MNLILIAVISLGAIALVLAAVLYVASKKFAVYEDPRIAQVSEVLPQANCGGCGYPGCSGFADACVKAGSLEGKFCPVGGQPVMSQVASILGLTPELQNRWLQWLDVTEPARTVRVQICMTVQRAVLLLLRFMAERPAVAMDVWDVATVWLPASSMLFT